MITNLNRIKMNQTLRRGRDGYVIRKVSKVKPYPKGGTHAHKKHTK